MIGAKTKLIGLLASPSGHSRSPMLHNRAFERLGLDYVYLAFDVNPQQLQAAVEGMRALGAAGFNLSMPNKIAVLPYLDDIDPKAALIGSVNTVVLEKNRWIGYNTDGEGFLKSLEEQGVRVQGRKIVVAGSGGAGMAVIVTCLYAGAQVTVLNRSGKSMDAVRRLKERLEAGYAGRLELLDTERNCTEAVLSSDIYVNATPLGMGEYIEQSPIRESNLLRPQMTVCDLIYEPKRTKLLQMAEEAGCRTLNGERMLFYQAAEAFFLWTGQRMPDEGVYEGVKEYERS